MEKRYNIDSLPFAIDNVAVVQDIEEAVDTLTIRKLPIVRFEFGTSMMPMLKSGQFCKISPVENVNDINIGDALFCDVNGYVGTHMVWMKSQINPNETWFLIGTTRMELIGWTKTVYGIATAIDHVVDEQKNEE